MKNLSFKEICDHERANMAIRRVYGYDQHDEHVWTWLLEMMWRRWQGPINPYWSPIRSVVFK